MTKMQYNPIHIQYINIFDDVLTHCHASAGKIPL